MIRSSAAYECSVLLARAESGFPRPRLLPAPQVFAVLYTVSASRCSNWPEVLPWHGAVGTSGQQSEHGLAWHGLRASA